MMFVMSDDLRGLATDQKIDYLFEILYDTHSMAYTVCLNADYFKNQNNLENRLETLEEAVASNKSQQNAIKRCVETPHTVWKNIFEQYANGGLINRYELEFLSFLHWRSENNWPIDPTESQARYAVAFLNGYERRKKKTSLLNRLKSVFRH